ncbi:uncharacterized protein LOC131845337 [Achroia grisella]|uniref:uncharacterized protein LOC131845337 n=1 Tax=Achroia grisella TaxID=688607 RepID=UPI0027D250E3|nr:uncharacterized protein LOC131845337 [Achroia grisella]
MLPTIVCSLLNTIFVTTLSLYRGLPQGPGQWSVEEIGGNCGIVPYPSSLVLARETLNSTADIYDGSLRLPYGIDNTYSITLRYTKLDSGGADNRVSSQTYGQFLYRYTVNTNIGQCRRTAETYPFYFPIPAGNYRFTDYVYNYKDYYLPTVGIYGVYRVTALLVRGQQTLGCTILKIAFE